MCQECAGNHLKCVMCEREVELATDTDLRSNEEVSHSTRSQLAVTLSHMELAPVHSASLNLERARECHRLAFLPGYEADRLRNMCKAHSAAEACVKNCESLAAEEVDKGLLAQALLMKANAAARISRHHPSKRQLLDSAFSDACMAASMLKSTANPQLGDAFRIMGLIEKERAMCSLSAEAREALRQARQHFLCAIRTFREQSLETSFVWSAVSYWDMFLIMQQLEGREAALPWLKRAAQLQAQIQGNSDPYTNLYQQRLGAMLGIPFSPDLSEMSSEEHREIEWALKNPES